METQTGVIEMAMTHKEMTAHIRNRIKASSIKARVRLFEACGVRYVQVFTTEYGVHFTAAEIRTIALIAKVNKLTGAQGSMIDIDHEALLTGKDNWSFEFWPALVAA